jgi:hypothetical protein
MYGTTHDSSVDRLHNERVGSAQLNQDMTNGWFWCLQRQTLEFHRSKNFNDKLT